MRLGRSERRVLAETGGCESKVSVSRLWYASERGHRLAPLSVVLEHHEAVAVDRLFTRVGQ